MGRTSYSPARGYIQQIPHLYNSSGRVKTMRSQREVKKYVGRMLPDAAKARVGRVYNYVRARRADRRFEPVALSQNAVDGAPRHVVCVVADALRADVIDAETTCRGAPSTAF